MLSLVSYNVMFNDILLEERHRALVALLLQNKSDVICLQEVLATAVSWFIQMLSERYNPVTTVLQPNPRPYGELIFVKKGINMLNYQCVPLKSKMGRALQHVQICKDSVEYNIVTFHLESLNSGLIRKAQLETMWSYFAGHPNAIFCGDTNVRDKDPIKLPENIHDSWTSTNQELGKWTYDGSRYWGNTRTERYDRVWHTHDLSVVGFGVLGNKPLQKLNNNWISDHDGLLVIFN